jgi:hypothetical protein
MKVLQRIMGIVSVTAEHKITDFRTRVFEINPILAGYFNLIIFALNIN